MTNYEPKEVLSEENCVKPVLIPISQISQDLSQLRDDQIPREIREEMLDRIGRGLIETRFDRLQNERNVGSSAAVHFHGHQFTNDLVYSLYYRIVKRERYSWEIQMVLEDDFRLPYLWHE